MGRFSKIMKVSQKSIVNFKAWHLFVTSLLSGNNTCPKADKEVVDPNPVQVLPVEPAEKL